MTWRNNDYRMCKGENIVYGGNIKVVAIGEIYEASRGEGTFLPKIS